MNNLRYCMISHHVHKELLSEDLARTGCYQNINMFGGDGKKSYAHIRHFNDVDPKEFENYDIIQINLSAQDYHLVNTIREIIGKDSSTKIVANCDYTTELWQGIFDWPQNMGRELEGADMIFGTEYFMCSALAELTGRRVPILPHPCHVKRLKVLPKEKKENVLSVIWHRYDSFSLIPYLQTRNLGIPTQLLGYNPNQDKKPYVTETLYNRILPGTSYQEYCKQLAKSNVILEPFTLNSYGRTTVDTAALGIPVVGSDRVQSVDICYPHTKVNPYDVYGAKKLLTKILNDEEFRDKVIKTAQENVEFYSHENCKLRFEKALEMSEKENNKNKK